MLNTAYRLLGVAMLYIVLGLQVSLQAQQIDLRYRVQLLILDASTNKPVQEAIVLTEHNYDQANQHGEVLMSTDGLSPDEQVQVRSLGYDTYYTRVKYLTAHKGVYRILLKPNVTSLKSVEVVGQKRTQMLNHIASHVRADKINSSVGTSLAKILEGMSGVSLLQSGTTVAKPVIQGMYGNRILIVNNGVRQAGQQWGEDHAPEVDMDSNNQIYVIKGAEAVRYGAEALGGVITVDNPLRFDSKRWAGEIATLYATNGRRTSSSVKLRGNLWEHLAWQAQGSYTNAGDRSTPNYVLNNTGVREQNFSLALGWKESRWSVEALYSRYDNKTGILPASGLRNQDEMYEYLLIGRPQNITKWSREISYPYHRVIHNLATLKARYQTTNWGTLHFQGSYQYDEREEYNIRRNNHSIYPTLSLHLSSTQLEARWEKDYHGWQTSAGIHFEQTDNYNLPGTGIEPLIPNYVDRTIGAYAIQKYQADRWGVEAGLRLDSRALTAAGIRFSESYGGNHTFTNLTYSLGGHYHLGKNWSITSNLGLAWRAPHVHELYSVGSEHGSGRYIIGDEQLKSEQSYKWITSLSKRFGSVQLSLDGYLQWIPGYIYDEPTSELQSTLSGYYPIFRYRQSDAFFRGVDVEANWRILPALSYRLTSSMIWANEQKTGRYFPYIPAFRLDQGLTYSFDIPKLEHSDLSVQHRFVARQHRFDRATDLTDSPAGYHLWSLEAHLGWQWNNRYPIDIYLSAENLLNQEYKEYTNRARYYSHDAGRNIRLTLRLGF